MKNAKKQDTKQVGKPFSLQKCLLVFEDLGKLGMQIG